MKSEKVSFRNMLKKIWYSLCASCRPRTSKTIRLAFPIVVVAALFAGAAAVITQNQSFISIETKPSSVKEGEAFFIYVTATAHTPVNAVDIEIEYPESQIEITSIDTGQSVISLWTEDPYAEDGIVHLRGGTFQKGFVGMHPIATIRAVATQSGIAHVARNSAVFVAGDGLGTLVDVTASNLDTTKVFISGTDGSLIGSASVQIITDIDGDGDVDLADISAFMAAWFSKNKVFDFNNDGKMTFRDFSILLSDYFFK